MDTYAESSEHAREIAEKRISDIQGVHGFESLSIIKHPCKHLRTNNYQGTVDCLDCGEGLIDMSGATDGDR